MTDNPETPKPPRPKRQTDRYDAIERALALLSEHWDEVDISVKTTLPDKSFIAARRCTPDYTDTSDGADDD